MKKIGFLFLTSTLVCLLFGCKSQAPTVRVVTGIHVTAESDGKTIKRTYTQDAKMSHVLNYLRLLDPYITVPLSPDTFRTDTYQITVSYSDGEQTQYKQIYHDYFQTDSGLWKRIDPELGARLQKIVASLEDDI